MIVQITHTTEDRYNVRRTVEALGGSIIEQKFTDDFKDHVMTVAGIGVDDLSAGMRKACRRSFKVEAIENAKQS